jgi:hypothetical protein
MDLYLTGTVMSSRIPKTLTIKKSSREFKEMNRGDSKRHVVHYIAKDRQRYTAGIVLWKDKNIVACLTNDTTTAEEDSCMRRMAGGLQRISRPAVIGKYNQYMGGVDVADMRRLQCNSTIMGQNRWWLKLFFYLLDVGTSNALVVYNEAMAEKEKKPMNIADFKLKIIESLVGHKMKETVGENGQAVEHKMTKILGNNRLRCSFCSLTSVYSRTRYMCEGCGNVPYCSIGSGKTDKDCFAIAHENENIRQLCVSKHEAQQRYTKTGFRKTT